jgi:hypothetical protein
MFVVHDMLLHVMAHGKDMDTAPALLSGMFCAISNRRCDALIVGAGFAGGVGGAVYALGATSSTNYMRYGYATWSSSLGSCFRGIRYTLARDGSYTPTFLV